VELLVIFLVPDMQNILILLIFDKTVEATLLVKVFWQPFANFDHQLNTWINALSLMYLANVSYATY